jgi:hypothetical protein
MTSQQNVQRQNELATADILSAALRFQDGDRRVSWLSAALRTKGEAEAAGLLVAFRTEPDQGGGDWVKGTWLTTERRFWEFEAVVPRQDGDSVVIERFEDATDTIVVSAYLPGTGKSFGYLALEVLDGRRAAARGA